MQLEEEEDSLDISEQGRVGRTRDFFFSAKENHSKNPNSTSVNCNVVA